MTGSTPFRLSEHAFRLYEPILLRAQEVFPVPIEFQIPNLRTTTVVARCRDALLAYKHNQLSASPWSSKLSVKVCADLKVYQIGSTAWVGGSQPSQGLVATQPPAVILTPLTHSEWSSEELKALCYLISQSKVEGGICVPLIPPSFVTLLEANYNISITTQPDGINSLIV